MLRRALLALILGSFLAPVALPAAAQSNDPSFRIVNNSGRIINEVYASPASDSSWGHDRLGNEVVRPGAQYIIRLPVGECVYDIRVVYQDRSAEERRGVNTCNITDYVVGGGAPGQPQTQQQPQQPRQPGPQAGAQQGNPSFNLVNQSGRVIEQFYASPASRSDWGSDRLGDDVVNPGQTYAIRLPQGECSYDLRWVFVGGGQDERRGVNACALTNYVVR